MGREIVDDLGGDIAVLVSAVGTGAALMGVADGLAKAGNSPKVIAVEPLQSPLLTTGTGGSHRVEGVGVGFEPPFLDRERLDGIRAVDQEKAFDMCRQLARRAGILCGGSTRLNVVAAIELARDFGPEKRIVTFGCDTGSKYLGGYIFE